jgi:outer membrane protein, multidrug efflux system
MTIDAKGSLGLSRFGMMALVALGSLTACAPEVPFDSPKFPFASKWRKSQSGSPVLLANDAWWEKLKDPKLNALMARALTGNLTIAAARERITLARAERKAIPRAALYSPSASIQQRGGTGTTAFEVGEADFEVNWLLDPWGGRRARLRSAAARIAGAEAERDAAQLLVLSNLANAYLELRYRQTLLAQGQADLRSRNRTLELTQQLQEADSATKTDTTRAAARAAEIEATIPILRAAIAAKRNEIAVLAGVQPGQLDTDLGSGAQPRPGISPQMGIPADLLRNRPDIKIAEQRYYAALANLGSARADRFPQLSLVGTINLASISGGRTTRQYAFGPSLSLPTQNSGAVEARESEVREAHTIWTQTVLSALLEVENALLDYQAVSQSLSATGRSARLYREAREQGQTVFLAGSATLNDLIDADADVARADAAQADARFRQALAYVALNVQIGAGHGVGERPANSN